MTTYPVPVAEMRERYLKLYSGAVNDILRFDYRMHAALPSEFAPLDRSMKLAGQAFTIKGAPDITTDGEFEMRAQMLEALPEDSIVVWDCTGDRVTAQWGEVMTMAAMRAGCRGALVNGIRDTDAILRQGFPIFNIYRSNVGMLGRFRMYYYQKPIRTGSSATSTARSAFRPISRTMFSSKPRNCSTGRRESAAWSTPDCARPKSSKREDISKKWQSF